MGNFVYGNRSQGRIDTCHDDLIMLAPQVLARSPIDFTIVRGWSTNEVQDALFAAGSSEKKGGESKHNHTEDGDPCSLALDYAPWVWGRIPWTDTHAFAIIAGVWMAVANENGILLRYGGDWDMDGSTEDQKLMDWGHIELAGKARAGR